MLIASYFVCKMRSVDRVPGPMIIGKANGTTEAVAESASDLYIEIFKHISSPSKNMIKLPARINESVLTANKVKK